MDRLTRVRSLDGLRAVAIAGVLAYHLGWGWAAGGYLGVDLFFVLSGFLITSLLLEESARTGRISLRAFWARRARRLLPALFVLLVAVAAFVAAMGRWGPPGWLAQVDLPTVRADALATLAYVANWHAIWAHQSYFAQFAAPSPLAHTWSLAIEEQFYLVWPLVLVGALAICRRRAWAPRALLAVLVIAGVVGSSTLMALLYRSGTDPSRVYFGTDTRCADLLVGAGLAIWALGRRSRGRAIHVAGAVAACLLAWCWAVAGTGGGLPRPWMFRGGFVGCALLAAVLLASVRDGTGLLARALSVGPLVWIGRISYGIYLWHWPVFVYLTPGLTGLAPVPLDLLRIGITLAVAAGSHRLVEVPLMRRAFPGWRRWSVAPAGVLVTALAVAAAPPLAAATPADALASATLGRGPVWSGVATGDALAGIGHVTGTLRHVPRPGDRRPLRVTVLGDSVARAAEPALAAALGATGAARVSNATIDGFGLSTDPIWRSSLPAIVGRDRTQVVVATWSWDDTCGPGSPTRLGRRGGAVCALEHPHRYEALLADAVRTVLAHGVEAVVFLQFPTTGPVTGGTPSARAALERARAAGERAWDRAARALAGVFPGRVAYLPVAAALLRDGRFTPWLPPVMQPEAPPGRWVRVRTMDNVHLCPPGAARYAAAVLTDLVRLLHLHPAAGSWAAGHWAANALYDTPPGSCPADHP